MHKHFNSFFTVSLADENITEIDPVRKQPVDDCDSEHCPNSGTRSDGQDDFFCDCSAGYTGKTCGEEKLLMVSY